jgi:16S rRNA U516 pseudouridylate synthase RsuA-like enzyme
MEVRLQKLIAEAGVASRRKAEDLILTGQVTINGQVVTTLGVKADPVHDHIKVRGKLIKIEVCVCTEPSEFSILQIQHMGEIEVTVLIKERPLPLA